MKRLFWNLPFVKRGMDAQNVVETPEGSKVLTFHHYTFSSLCYSVASHLKVPDTIHDGFRCYK